ncbi:hypothetical protein CHM34_13760 [Paludifilum halophilum]|uniref:Uncharacterized protein n=1 Tax=Paludifilum halophilum TaxID=1642702 RepID=A0A235B3X5_9BACL|nr:hypothetical protein CHM34_13760 [Paludifilum halophilum]
MEIPVGYHDSVQLSVLYQTEIEAALSGFASDCGFTLCRRKPIFYGSWFTVLFAWFWTHRVLNSTHIRESHWAALLAQPRLGKMLYFRTRINPGTGDKNGIIGAG